MLIYGEEADDKAIVKMPRYRADSQFNRKQVAFALTQKCDLVGKLSVFLQAAALLPNHFRINQPTISDVSFLI